MSFSESSHTPDDEPPPERGVSDRPAAVDLNVEYIKAMIEWTKDDVRQIYLRVTASLGIAVLVLTQLPFEKLAELNQDWLFLGSLALLLISAVAHFSYLSRVHRSRRDLALCLRKADGATAKRVWQDTWDRSGMLFVAGDVILVLGLIGVGFVVLHLLQLPPGTGGAD
jgi:hypothetical protein